MPTLHQLRGSSMRPKLLLLAAALSARALPPCPHGKAEIDYSSKRSDHAFCGGDLKAADAELCAEQCRVSTPQLGGWL